MMEITLLYADDSIKEVEEKILPQLSDALKIAMPYSQVTELGLKEGDFVLCYLSDEQLKGFLPLAEGQDWGVGFLPHPEMIYARQGFGVGKSIDKSIAHVLESEEFKSYDLLTANGQIVFDSVSLGDSMSLMYGQVERTWLKQLSERFKGFFGLFKRVKLHPYTLLIPKENGEKDQADQHYEEVNTAALGMVVVPHGKSSLLSRRILEDSFVNDGMLHALILAPQSVMGLLSFGLVELFSRKVQASLPPFTGHIRTSALQIKSEEAIALSIDGVKQRVYEIVLETTPKALKIVPGRFLETEVEANNREVFKIQVLPRGELREELLRGPLPYIYHATTEEFKDLFSLLRENSRPKSTFLVLMVLSTIIATFGLFANSSPVIIGAMVLAPLMSPIISLSMGVLRQDKKLALNSLKTLVLGLLLGYICAVLLTWLTPLNTLNGEITARIRPNLLDLGVAAASGAAGAYAHSKKEIAKTLAGVAIAVALVPPMAVSGIGLGWADWAVFSGSLLLLVTNLAGMVLSAAFTFLLLGFSPFHLAKKGLVWSLVLVFCVSAPLTFGFTNLVRENKLLQKLSGYQVNGGITLRNVEVRSLSPIVISVKAVSGRDLSEEDFKEIKKEIEGIIGEEVVLEITVGLKI
ncbi:TIGR00341 family protein [Echinicola marina]|uniref:TIGR00341 family protein n=1 Tax=Echinicola marina TaxID=2859768 RepID=UPI001CF64F85|nr:TIGR00341 family protein [Echinicola marina]UCS93463.1 TIGR00341 family protein [Echinicola marina]